MGRSPTTIDWDAVERDYRFGQLTLRQIAEKHGVHLVSVAKKAKRERWEQDLSRLVISTAKAKVVSLIAEEANNRLKKCEKDTYSEFDLAANATAAIIMRQQKRAEPMSRLLAKMISELEFVTDDPKSLEVIAMAINDSDPQASEMIGKLKSLPTRMSSLKTASEIMTNLNNAERKAFSIDDNGKPAEILEDILLRVMGEE